MTEYYFAALCFILLAMSNGEVIDDPLQHEDNTYQSKRYRRGGPSYNSICDDWSDWINDYYPDEVESLSQDDLDWFCPPAGKVTALQCKDINGQPFSNKINETSRDGNYMYSCMKPIDGASCYPIKVNASCPDFSISFFCTCTATTISTGSNLQIFTTNVTPQTLSSNGTEVGNNKNAAGGSEKYSSSCGCSNSNNSTFNNVLWWLIPLLISAVLFTINVIIIVYLHKKVQKQIRQTIHPM